MIFFFFSFSVNQIGHWVCMKFDLRDSQRFLHKIKTIGLITQIKEATGLIFIVIPFKEKLNVIPALI